MGYAYTEEKLKELYLHALDLFNDCIESDIAPSNTMLAFFTPANGVEVYETFCAEHFPNHLQEPYRERGYFEGIAAQAFVGDGKYGILFRSDLDFPPHEVLFTFMHEISHLYCTSNEIPGGHFFDRFCMGSGGADGQMNAGYAIWREFVADLMASSVLSETTSTTLSTVRKTVMRLYDSISATNLDSKKCMSLILVYIMNTKEVACTTSWNEAEHAISKKYKFDDMMMYGLKLVFDSLQERPFWSITPDFIMELGGVYLSILSVQTLKHLRFDS